jgi:hypothetical protein
MIKNKKGQIMVLDILFSVVLIILVSFLLVNIVESKVYSTTTDNINSQLNNVGKMAFKNIVNNPYINCYAFDSHNRYHIPACLTVNSNISKNNLGIPTNYKCSIAGYDFTTNECTDVLDPSIDNYYSIDFNVSITPNFAINKKRYIDSLSGNDNILDTKQELNLKVWR